ncbi:MAG: glycosyltransferase family 2 protein, partial [Nanoarchaeota archaeon]|nr:glycosyltransferase family 2 protein [Nanoarchaeota archaeon]
GVWLTVTHNGFRALSRDAAKKIEITQDRMAHASEIIDQIRKKRIRYTEIPVTITYTSYSIKKGQSAMNSIRIAARLIWSKYIR